MRALQKQHIVDVFVLVDDNLPKHINQEQSLCLRTANY